MEQWATGPATRRRPVAPWVRRNKFLVALIAVLLAALVAGSPLSLSGEDGERPSAATLPPVTKGAKWVTGLAGNFSRPSTPTWASSAPPSGPVSATRRSAAAQLAADVKTALGGPMPPVGAAIYRVGLNDLAKAGTDVSSGNASQARALLAVGNGNITKVTAAANPAAPGHALVQSTNETGSGPRRDREWPRLSSQGYGSAGNGSLHGAGRDIHEEDRDRHGCGGPAAGRPAAVPPPVHAVACPGHDPCRPANTAGTSGTGGHGGGTGGARHPARGRFRHAGAHGARLVASQRRPGNGPEFQWELDHPLSSGSTLDMGSGVLNAAGRWTPRVGLYDIDGILSPASTVAALHRRGAR